MILQFSVSNYRGFKELQTLNFTASNYDKTLPQNCIEADLPGQKGRKWLKGIAVYGPNASGKSTLLDALKALKSLVLSSARATDPKESINQIEAFALEPNPDMSPTAFGIVFVSKDIRFEYRVAATSQRIWHESLRAFPTSSEQLWFSRNWEPNEEKYCWSPDRPTGYQRDSKREEFTLPNALYLSTAVKLADTQLESVFGWFREKLRFLDLSGRQMRAITDRSTKNTIFEGGEASAKVINLLRHGDIGVTDALVTEEFPEERSPDETGTLPNFNLAASFRPKFLRATLFHSSPGPTSQPLPWNKESAGTHRLFALAGPWLEILSKGSVVCIDELENSLHPLIIRELLRLVFSSDENTSGAQILFTTHNPFLLDSALLRRDQVWFTDKDEKGISHLYPLSSYTPRKGESLVRGYLAGRYGAVPFIPEGLLGSFPSFQSVETSANEGFNEQ